MNVIFLDFEGVLITHQDKIAMFNDEKIFFPYDKIEKRIALLAEICNEYNCKIVIEASGKNEIDEETMKIKSQNKFTQYIFEMFKKYGIECIGRTPNVERRIEDYTILPMWKEDEIRLYLLRHPEIEHYCVLDDDDTISMLHWKTSDLEKVKTHLVKTEYYSELGDGKEGLLPYHKEEIGRALQKENEIRRLVNRWGKKNK